MKELESIIQSTIDKAYLPLTYGCANALEMMIAMRDQFKPTDIATKRMILKEWNSFISSPDRGTDIDRWLVNIESTFERARRYKVVEILPNSVLLLFLDALRILIPEFQAIIDTKVTAEEELEFKDCLRYYRNYRRNTAVRPKARSRQQGFDASF